MRIFICIDVITTVIDKSGMMQVLLGFKVVIKLKQVSQACKQRVLFDWIARGKAASYAGLLCSSACNFQLFTHCD